METAAGLRVLVVGAAGSIGPFIARRFVEDGADVVIADINEERLEGVYQDLLAYAGRTEQHVVDVRSESSVEQLYRFVHQTLGGLDVLVNSFAVLEEPAPAWQLPVQTWRETLEVELTGVFLCSTAAVRLMQSQRQGTIITISSIAGKMPYRLRAAYAVAKAAVNAFTRCLALEVAEFGITVNAICPGPVHGPRIQRVVEKRAEVTGQPVAEVERQYLEHCPLGEFVHPVEIAELCAFLASPHARHITGQLIDVDSGYLLKLS